jgi:hypothetical protein
MSVERHLTVDELRNVVFELGNCDRALEHVKKCEGCAEMVASERVENPLLNGEVDFRPSEMRVLESMGITEAELTVELAYGGSPSKGTPQ